LEAQQTAVRDFLNGGDWRLVAEVTEVESSKRSDRPKLAEALKLSRIHGAVLVIAKLDRLARPPPVIAGIFAKLAAIRRASLAARARAAFITGAERW
jgi:DNA invertase Pin-like site-specific DNA recombinase